MASDRGTGPRRRVRDTHHIRDLERILETHELQVVFQPILGLRDGVPHGYEALLRPPEWSCYRTPLELLNAATDCGLIWDLEGIIRSKILSVATGLFRSEYLFINISPAVFCDPRLPDVLESEFGQLSCTGRERVILELTEHSNHDSVDDLTHAFEELRERGFRLAIDDVGAGSSGLNRIMGVHPNWLKLDRELITHVDSDPFRRNLIRSFVHFATLSDIRLVAEGIEREQELQTLIELGVDHGQGYLLGRPAPAGTPTDPYWSQRIPFLRREAGNRRCIDPHVSTIGPLAIPLTCCDSGLSVADVRSLVRHFDEAPGLALMDGKRFVGFVSAESLREIRHSTYSGRPIMDFDEKGWVVADRNMTIAETIELATSRSDDDLAAPIMVFCDDEIGLLPMRDLLRAAAAIRPTQDGHRPQRYGVGSLLDSELEFQRRIRGRDSSSIAYVDICHLYAYSRIVGDEFADAVLGHVAKLLNSTFAAVDEAFVGHISDDRFVVIASGEVLRAKLPGFCAEFDSTRNSIIQGTSAIQDRVGLPTLRLQVLIAVNAFLRVTETRGIFRLGSLLGIQTEQEPEDGSPACSRIIEDPAADRTLDLILQRRASA